MIALRDEPKIISMAHTLGIHAGDTVEGIRDFCRRKVHALVAADSRAPRSIEDLEHLVCERMHLDIVEVWNDDDLTEVIEKYARREKEPSFGVLRRDLDDETFATLIQRKRPPGQQAYHYVAVIDCRGEKSARRFFTRWHEIAHVLTLVGQLELPLHRSTVRKDPVERMMDLIAGDIGFFEPLFQPVLDAECASERGLSFAAVENVRATFCPSASLEATLHACVNKFASPVILLQAAFGHRAEVQRLLASGQGDLFSGDPPAPQLRVPISTGNPAARAARLIIPKTCACLPAV